MLAELCHPKFNNCPRNHSKTSRKRAIVAFARMASWSQDRLLSGQLDTEPENAKPLTVSAAFAIQPVMNNARFRRSLLLAIAGVLLAGSSAAALPCDPIKTKPDNWVKGEVNALVLAAHAWYERDS